MKKPLLLAVMVLCSTFAAAEEPTRLQCSGTYDNYLMENARDIPAKGVYVEVSEKHVKVLGAPGLSATYSIITRNDHGIGFQLHSDGAYGGFLNRLSGDLSLMQTEAAANGSKKAIQMLSATCVKARPLF
jgi:hypothetical protein